MAKFEIKLPPYAKQKPCPFGVPVRLPSANFHDDVYVGCGISTINWTDGGVWLDFNDAASPDYD
jgi:hypothetical protein